MSTLTTNLTLGRVTLTVADLGRSLNYYQRHIGLTVRDKTDGAATLGTPTRDLLHLIELRGAQRDPRASGLYHFALLLPSRFELARTIQHFDTMRTPVGGASDHSVSEALYLNDPDGHGIEIYRDRPRSTWYKADGSLFMTSGRMDIDDIMQEIADGSEPWQGIAADTVMGHVHLQVANVATTQAFYTDVIGFDRMVGSSSASFLSVDGYHHHLGMNTWHSRGRTSADADAASLQSYEVQLATKADVAALAARLDAHGVAATPSADGLQVADPSGNQIIFHA